jgi:hypothetical protein
MKMKVVISAFVAILVPVTATSYEWARRYGSNYGEAAARGIALSPVGTPYVTGKSGTVTYFSYFLTCRNR